ncbi:conserved hypothetical protein [Frankia sp. AiPs1]|uniref:hypothetical protein n=1 Tax=Frankia sp. AiPa1 TaxID=573492 RepID=UPI00202AE860|nr:hypothetical protein [Frankia sp. AiPa1]MCL9760892.1 hypothetical protein [Frankia sp. AiPa1]
MDPVLTGAAMVIAGKLIRLVELRLRIRALLQREGLHHHLLLSAASTLPPGASLRGRRPDGSLFALTTPSDVAG